MLNDEPPAQWIVDAYNRPDPNPFLFVEGQKVRVLKGRSNDGQTPAYWDGAIAVVVDFYCTGLMKEHYYKLRHLENGFTDSFKECEIDRRYVRNQQPSPATNSDLK